MGLQKIFVFLFLFIMCYRANSSMVKLVIGGYEDIVIAINPTVTENVKIIENIQEMVNEATGYLYKATKQRLFIRNVKILIPLTWTKRSNYTKTKTETYDKADIIIANPFLKYGDEPYTLQYGGCGEQGKYIHLTPDFMIHNGLSNTFGPRGRVFVHEWAHLRWGVFDEYNKEVPFYIAGNGAVEATRCSLNIRGKNIIQQCVGASCTIGMCSVDPITGLYEDGCSFVLDKNQLTQESIMYSQALPSVSDFCDATTHNIEAPTLQNRMCNLRSTWEVIMNSTDIKSTPPSSNPSVPAPPTFSLLQPSDRVVTLVLDVSGSMATYNRIRRLYQAAEVFLIQIIELHSYVGIVQFSDTVSVTSNLVQIVNDDSRQTLKNLLPKTAQGGTDICLGIQTGFQVNLQHDGSSYGSEIILVTAGEDNYDTSLCFNDIKVSGAIVHTIALGPTASSALEDITKMTGGLQFFATDNAAMNGLVDAFSGISSGSEEISKQAIQLESTGLNLAPNQCLNGTVYIDNTVGNDTFFLVTWQMAVPAINLQNPKGKIYTAANFVTDPRSSRLPIPGTAERGPWHYSLCNQYLENQVIGIIVNSKAADANVPPITVNAHINRDINQFPNPIVVYASVSQGFLPVKGAKVTATIEPATGSAVTLELLDNGAGADIVKNDGVYSRYFTAFTTNGRYNLKVQAESKQNRSRLAFPWSRALYVPGYIENGVVDMNPPNPVISDDDIAIDLGAFSRTASGGSFLVTSVPPDPQPDIYKPGRISDLKATIEESAIVLSWTATGDDLDQGIASRYDLRMSNSLKDLRDNFENSTSVDISSLTPQQAGSSETFTFVPENIVITNGTILYFALIAFDKVPQKSDLSNIAQAALLIPSTPEPTTEPTTTPSPTPPLSKTIGPKVKLYKMNITHQALIICSAVIIISITISVTVCFWCSKKKKRNPEMYF
ncbi:calcium-activated chloride channel regulator 1-like [Bombina bombina]|uniref:calcium-activated chloride channel regulator 1-like n=1 Tax=Bombina bombina TaxID=8345 RepID=UPI00235AC28E|nr:calcium-activated chloride channel regulator 1-like [Bombina bombina]